MSAEDVKGGPVIPVETVPQPLGDPSFYDAAGKSPQQIEADIDHTRTELGEILDALERRLAPRHMLERGVDMLKETMSGNTGKIGETLRDNPVPLALIGLGVGWMLLSSTGATRRLSEASGQLGEQLGEQASGVGERVSGLGDRLTGTVRSLGQRAGAWAGSVKERFAGSGASSEEAYPTGAMEEPMAGYAYARQKTAQGAAGVADAASGTLSDAARRAREATASGTDAVRQSARRVQEAGSGAVQRAGAYAQYAGDRMAGARDRFADLLDEHPLTVGAVGFLAGAVLGFMLPTSRAEEEWVGPVGEQLRDRAGQIGREAVDRAQEVTGRAVDAAVDAVKEAVSDVGDAVAKPAGAAAEKPQVAPSPRPAGSGSGSTGMGGI